MPVVRSESIKKNKETYYCATPCKLHILYNDYIARLHFIYPNISWIPLLKNL